MSGVAPHEPALRRAVSPTDAMVRGMGSPQPAVRKLFGPHPPLARAAERVRAITIFSQFSSEDVSLL